MFNQTGFTGGKFIDVYDFLISNLLLEDLTIFSSIMKENFYIIKAHYFSSIILNRLTF